MLILVSVFVVVVMSGGRWRPLWAHPDHYQIARDFQKVGFLEIYYPNQILKYPFRECCKEQQVELGTRTTYLFSDPLQSSKRFSLLVCGSAEQYTGYIVILQYCFLILSNL